MLCGSDQPSSSYFTLYEILNLSLKKYYWTYQCRSKACCHCEVEHSSWLFRVLLWGKCKLQSVHWSGLSPLRISICLLKLAAMSELLVTKPILEKHATIVGYHVYSGCCSHRTVVTVCALVRLVTTMGMYDFSCDLKLVSVTCLSQGIHWYGSSQCKASPQCGSTDETSGWYCASTACHKVNTDKASFYCGFAYDYSGCCCP